MSNQPQLNHELTKEPIYCDNCGDKSFMSVICDKEYSYSVKVTTDYYQFNEHRYRIYICSICHRPTVTVDKHCSENEWDIPDEDGNLETIRYGVQREKLFPTVQGRFDNAPDQVLCSYNVAARLLNAEPIACAVFVGRTLEFICKDFNAEGKNLGAMLEDLESREIISKPVLELARSLKSFRNIAAHADPQEISYEDAKLLLSICKIIIEYAYEISGMLETMKVRLKTANTD